MKSNQRLNRVRLLVAAGLLVMTSACALTNGNVTGTIYTETKNSVTATSNQTGTRVGESCSQAILGFASGDSSIETARRNGGITLISSVDSSVKNILGVYVKYCTIVRGR